MNELIKVTQNENNEPVVSGRELHKFLEQYNSFDELFIVVSKMKIELSLDTAQLRRLRNALSQLDNKFGVELLSYLKDSIDCEIALTNTNQPKQYSEKLIQNEVISNFDKYFSPYKLICKEYPVEGVGRIDLLAQTKDGRAVIIELKHGRHNPIKQLLAYATHFYDPILIGITDYMPNKLPHENIHLYSVDELRKGCQLPV